MTMTSMNTGEKLRNHQTRSLRLLSSNLAKWFVLPYLSLAHLTVMARRTQSRNFLNSPPNCVLRSNLVSPQLPKAFAWGMVSFLLIPAYTHSMIQSNRTTLQNSILRGPPVLLVYTY